MAARLSTLVFESPAALSPAAAPPLPPTPSRSRERLGAAGGEVRAAWGEAILGRIAAEQAVREPVTMDARGVGAFGLDRELEAKVR